MMAMGTNMSHIHTPSTGTRYSLGRSGCVYRSLCGGVGERGAKEWEKGAGRRKVTEKEREREKKEGSNDETEK